MQPSAGRAQSASRQAEQCGRRQEGSGGVRQRLKRGPSVPWRPPRLQAEVAGNDRRADIAGAAGNRPAGMPGGTRIVEVWDRRAVTEMVVHHLFAVEGAHEYVAA